MDWRWARDNEKLVMTRVAFAGLLLGLVIVELASFVPALAPSHVELWRWTLGVPAALTLAAMLPYAIRGRTPSWMIWLVLAVTMAIVVTIVMISPPTWAMLLTPVAIVVFAGYFLRGWAVVLTTALLSVAVLSLPIFAPAGTAHEYDAARLIVYLPVLWALAATTYFQTRDLRASIDQAIEASTSDLPTGILGLRSAQEDFASRVSSGAVSVLLVSVAGLARIRESHGDEAETDVLVAITRHLRRVMRKEWTLARIDAGDFIVIASGLAPQRADEIAVLCRGAALSASIDLEIALKVQAAAASTNDPECTLERLLDVAQASILAEDESEAGVVAAIAAPRHIERTDDALGGHAHHDPAIAAALDTAGAAARRAKAFVARRIGACATIAAALVLLVALAFPGADWKDPRLAALIALGCLALGIVALLAPNVARSRTAKKLIDFAVFVVLGVLIAMTGGSSSPVMALVFVYVAAQSWLWQADRIVWRLTAPVLLLASPLLYESVLTRTFPEARASFQVNAIVVALVAAIASAATYRSRAHAKEVATLAAAQDPETGLLNRRAFELLTEKRVEEGRPCAVIRVEIGRLDRFTRVHGRSARTRLLCAAGETLRTLSSEGEFAGRLGSAQLALFVRVDAENFVARGERVRQRLQDVVDHFDGSVQKAPRIVVAVVEQPAAQGASPRTEAQLALDDSLLARLAS
ncbi:MAG: diguanylate cyclase [Solirubrobacterales bacterium]